MVSVIGPDMSEDRRQKRVRVDLPVKELGQAVEGVCASGPLIEGRDVVPWDSCNHVIILVEGPPGPGGIDAPGQVDDSFREDRR
jgi:hypothetical protein